MNSILELTMSLFHWQHLQRTLHLATTFLVFIMNCSVPQNCFAQVENKTASGESPLQFDNPQELAKHWMTAVNRNDWREEYHCYAGTQQAQFTYHIMISVREFSDAKDLSDKCDLVFRHFSFPTEVLDRFTSLRTDLSDITDQNQIAAVIKKIQELRKEQLTRWQREVQPMNVDWAGIIEQLQPLFTESYRRHAHDIHPSTNGIAHHLSYHRFELPLINRIEEKTAEGSVVAVIYDPNIVVALDNKTSSQDPSPSLTERLQSFAQTISFRKTGIRRSPERMTFTKVDDTWFISTVPFR